MSTTPKKRQRSFPVKPEALTLMQEKMREKGFIFTTQEEMYAELAEKAGLNSSDTIKNVFNPQYGRKPEKNTIQSIASALGLYPWDIVEGWNPPECSSRIKPTDSKVSIFNRQLFQEMLDKQRSLTTNPLINANFEASKLYVALGLVESKTREKRKDVTPETGSRLYQPEEYEVTQKFENDEFLQEVLLQGNSPKSQGKRIAIIGEPGSGKTTRLQQVADKLFSENDESLVIWVSLADLQDENLEDFLLNTWLKSALKQKEASEESQNKLIEKFNEGNVWLLLDGLDEMRLDHNPLYWVNSQIKGWIESAKIILTCRVNVWESGNNYLNKFDVYRNLDFSELQRDEFIYKFLTDRNLAEQLITELNQDGKERIRDLVKNPLRLTLVCHSWEKHQGSLPETKAGLYQECVEAFYLWKEVEFQTTIAQREALNRALGKLAKQALEQELSKFRLTHRFVCEVLGESDEGLFKLALDLGWLNRVGIAEENPNEQVYAFFHPSFQEYFASLVIDDWDYFISRTQSQLGLQSVLEGNYRIFDSNIKEVSMYYIGRENISQYSKEEFIKTLLSFNPDNIDTAEDLSNLVYILFEYRAYSIAIELFAELPVSAFTSSLVERIVVVMCNHVFDYDKYKNLGLDIETPWLYKEALAKLKSNDQLVLKIIENLFETQVNISAGIKYNILGLLDQVSINSDKNQALINDLFDKITKWEDYNIQWKFIKLTQEYISNSQKAQEILRDIIHLCLQLDDKYDSTSQFFLIDCLYMLENLKINNEQNNNILTVSEFLNILRQTKNAKVCHAYLCALLQKNLGTSEDLNDLFSFFVDLESLKHEYIELQYPKSNDYQPGDVSLQVIYIKELCSEITRKIGHNQKEFIDIVFRKIECALKIDIDCLSSDFPYDLLHLFDLYYKSGGESSKKLFLVLINFLANQQKFIVNSLNVDEYDGALRQVINEMYEMCAYQNDGTIEQDNSIVREFTTKEKESILMTISSIIRIAVNKKSCALSLLSLLRLSKIWHLLEPENLEALNYTEHFDKLLKEAQEKYYDPFDKMEAIPCGISFAEYKEARPSKQEFEELKEKVEIDFQPNSNKDIILLTNYLLFEDIDIRTGFWDEFINITRRTKGELACYNLEQTNDPKLLQEIVFLLKFIFISPQSFDSVSERRQLCFKVLWHCANKLTYQEFMSSWFSVKSGQLPNIHPEVVDYTSVGGNSITQTLNQQILDLPSQLQPTEKTYPIIINAQSLEDETDNNSIAQELCNQIYTIVFPNETNIPEINNAPQLKRLIPNLKKQLNTQNLALIFHNGEPNESLTKFCKKLTDIIHIKWITEQPIAYGIPPQENLVNILQNWINQLD